jgi:hypothetical protein
MSIKASPQWERVIPRATKSSSRYRRKLRSQLSLDLPGESWRTLLQTFRTKTFLALSDLFNARTASELCGKEEQLKLS